MADPGIPNDFFDQLGVNQALRAIVARSAEEYERTGDWVTFDTLAYERAECDEPDTLNEVFTLPSAFGGVWTAEKLQLTGLGLVLASTAPQTAKLMTRLAEICAERKLRLRDDAMVGQQILTSEYGFSDAEAQRARNVIDLLPGVSGGGNLGDDWLLTIFRTALDYRNVHAVDDLRVILEDQARERLRMHERSLAVGPALHRGPEDVFSEPLLQAHPDGPGHAEASGQKDSPGWALVEKLGEIGAVVGGGAAALALTYIVAAKQLSHGPPSWVAWTFRGCLLLLVVGGLLWIVGAVGSFRSGLRNDQLQEHDQQHVGRRSFAAAQGTSCDLRVEIAPTEPEAYTRSGAAFRNEREKVPEKPLRLQVTNFGTAARFRARVAAVDGARDSVPTPWEVPWEGQTESERLIASNEPCVLTIAVADAMNWKTDAGEAGVFRFLRVNNTPTPAGVHWTGGVPGRLPTQHEYDRDGPSKLLVDVVIHDIDAGHQVMTRIEFWFLPDLTPQMHVSYG